MAGALAAFVAFTLPSALLLIGFAAFLPMLSGSVGQAAIHGLKIVALAVVAQAVPGPMFSLAAYLGYGLSGVPGGLAGAGIVLVSIFLPGFLLVAGLLPHWRRLAGGDAAMRAIAGVNAAVVGLLAAALVAVVWCVVASVCISILG